MIGVVGYLMRRYDFPTAPVIIGMILGPLAEQRFPPGADHLGRRLDSVFFTRPLSATILVLALLALVGPKLYALWSRPKPERIPGMRSGRTGSAIESSMVFPPVGSFSPKSPIRNYLRSGL